MKINFCNYLIVMVFTILVVFLASCASVLPPSGTIIDCNGQQVIPLKNPSIRATFPNGDNAMMAFIAKNFDHSKGKLIGSATIAFIVTKEGEICDVRITSKPKDYLANEIVRILKIMPTWDPAINDGEIVDCYRYIKFRFRN